MIRVLALVLVCAQWAIAAAPGLKIGLITSLTRKDRITSNPWGKFQRDGLLLGLESCPHCTVLTRDNSEMAPESALNARQLIGEGVDVLVGLTYSDQALMVKSEADKYAVPFLAIMATSSQLFSPGGGIFSMGLSNESQAVLLGEALDKHLGNKRPGKVGLIVARNCTFCVDLEKQLHDQPVNRRIEWVRFPDLLQRQPMPPKYFEERTLPDTLVILTYETEAVSALQQLGAVGYKGAIFGGDSWSAQTLQIESLGKTVSNSICLKSTVGYDRELNTPENQRFMEAFRLRFGAEVTDVGALAYDAGKVLSALSKRCATQTDRKACVRRELTQVSINGASGTVRFTSSGTRVGAGHLISSKGCRR